MRIPADGTGGFFVNGNTLKLADSLPPKILLMDRSFTTPHDSGPESDYFADDGACTVLDNIMVAVEQSDDGIRGLFNADYVVRIQKHQLSVHTCQCNHAVTANK